MTPVESFNRADVLLGVTRAMQSCEGESASSADFYDEMSKIQGDLFPGGSPNLVPVDRSRNVVRRQGRYWRGLGILSNSSSGTLKLTSFGKDFADGSITNADFVSSIIQSHVIPNPRIETDATIKNWDDNGIKIYPLKLILGCLIELVGIDPTEGYLTPQETAKILIPLSIKDGHLDVTDYAQAIIQFRSDPSSADSLPDCTPRANDQRMVREHFLFLTNFDVLQKKDMEAGNSYEQYSIDPSDVEKVAELLKLKVGKVPTSNVGSNVEIDEIRYDPTNTRERKTAEITVRPNQAKFRKMVLRNAESKCLITGESITEVIDACHVKEIHDGGTDDPKNGICLRKDLHTLFDRGKLRIKENGEIYVSEDLSTSKSYANLPNSINLPNYIDKDLLRRRFAYGI